MKYDQFHLIIISSINLEIMHVHSIIDLFLIAFIIAVRTHTPEATIRITHIEVVDSL